jgi:hypothetical protein
VSPTIPAESFFSALVLIWKGGYNTRMEKTIYTRSWADGVAKDFSRDLFRSALFALIILIGFFGGLLLMSPSEDLSNLDEPPVSIPEFLGLAVLAFIVLVSCCYVALFFVADDRRWGIQEPTAPHIWDDREERWITSTVSFAHYLEERGSHIEAALVQYDDPRVAAHRMIDKVDERTLQLYLSLLSAMQMERERVTVESIEVKPKTLDGKTRQA